MDEITKNQMLKQGVSIERICVLNTKAFDQAEINNYTYVLSGDLSFIENDIMAGSNMVATTKDRVNALVLSILRHAVEKGNMCVARDELSEGVTDVECAEWHKGAQIDTILLLRSAEYLLDHDYAREYCNMLYASENAEIEEVVACKLTEYLQGMSPQYQDCEISAAIAARQPSNITLDQQQIEAVETALKWPLVCLTGGPGSGKTTVLRMIEDVAQELDPRVKIINCALSGKAARRMEETTGRTAMTIASLCIKGGAVDDRQVYLVIDEASMVDLPTFGRLLYKIFPDKILFVGDINQLGPIGAGYVYRDLLSFAPTVRLTRVYRQQQYSGIIDAAGKVVSPSVVRAFPIDTRNTINNDICMIDALYNDIPNEIKKTVKHLHRIGYDYDDIQVLAPTREACAAINKLLQKLINPVASGETGKDEKRSQLAFRVGDRVIYTVNNYDLNLRNGHIGKVVAMDERIVNVKYGERIVNHKIEDAVLNLELAYAITIHKSQGSSYPAVIMAAIPSRVLSRNAIYTGITRAEQKCVVIGDRNAITAGMIRVDADKHRSCLQQRIAKKLAGEKKQEDDEWQISLPF